MKYVLVILMWVSSVCFAKDKYILSPQGSYTLIIDWLLKSPKGVRDCRFSKFGIFEETPTGQLTRGEVEEVEWGSLSYVYKVGEDQISSIQLDDSAWFAWAHAAKAFQVLDSDETIIGSIEGNFFTEHGAEFLFYNEEKQIFAKAFLDREWTTLKLVSSEEEPLFTCTKIKELKGGRFGSYDFFQDRPVPTEPELVYYWTIEKEGKQPFDGRFFWPFVSFICQHWWWDS